jgi:class 3 adenylate cyclase
MPYSSMTTSRMRTKCAAAGFERGDSPETRRTKLEPLFARFGVTDTVGAAIELRDALGRLDLPDGVTLRSRIGVATGPVVVNERAGRGDGRGKGIVGETPHLAARLQTVAKPDMVAVADTTRRLAGGPFT